MLKKIKDWIGSNLDVYKVESASDVGAGLYRHVWKGRENATQIGTTLNAEIMNNLQNSLVHSINATKTTGTGTDYYICNLDGLTEFGLNNDLKLRITVDNANTNTTTKLRLNNVDYTLLKEQNGTLKQIEAGDIHVNKTYELIYNGSQFVVINLFKNFESSYLDNCIKKTDYATENKAGIVTLGTTANTALEGKRLSEIIGLEFGGNIQDVGNKTKGKFYFDSVTKFYYECIADTNLTYNESSKFRAISNRPILDKVENLFKIQKSQEGSIKFGGIEIKWGIVPDGSATLVFPKPFDNACLSIQLTRLGKPVNDTTGSGASGASTILAIYRTHFDVDSVIGDRDKSELTYLAIGYWAGNM